MSDKMLERVRVGGSMVESPRGVVPSGYHDRQYNHFLEKLQLRKADSDMGSIFRLALAAYPDVRFQTFLAMMESESSAHLSLGAIAKMCEIGLDEFRLFWRDAQRNRALDHAIEQLPSITKDMVDDAKSDETTCPMCDGTGQVEREGKPPKICPNCTGKGIVRTIGDKHARNKLLEMTGAIKKEPAIVINQDMRGLGMNAAANRLKAVSFDLDPEPIDSTPEPQ